MKSRWFWNGLGEPFDYHYPEQRFSCPKEWIFESIYYVHIASCVSGLV